MGFPDRASSTSIAFMEENQNRIGVGGYVCPQCRTRVSEVPMTCPVCKLMLISSAHLARSYHHLFPVPLFQEIIEDSEAEANEREHRKGDMEKSDFDSNKNGESKVYICSGCSRTISEGVKLRCPRCAHTYCFDCDAYIHDRLFVCPTCSTC